MISRMLRKIPAWFIGVIGGMIVIISSIVSSYFWTINDSNINDNKKQITQLEQKTSRLWDSHQLADSRSTIADHFVGQYLMAKENKGFYLSKAGHNLRGAVLAMYAATELDVPNQPPEEIMVFEKKLEQGDLSAYSSLMKLIDSLRLQSMQSINKLKNNRTKLAEENQILDSKREFIRLVYVSLNIFGLIIVLLKDLPVWAK
jgi:hypothetical protein